MKEFDYKVNNMFREYFSNDVNQIINNINGIESVNLHWLSIVDSAVVRIEYKDDLTKEEKKRNLDKLKNELESRWYTKIVEYDVVVYLGTT